MPGGQAPMNAKDDPFSPENIAQVAEEISKLTPEQQEQLYKESLDFLSKELNLSPEEVEKMITDEFTQGGAPTPEVPQPKGPSAETLKAEIAPSKKAVEEKIVPIKDLNDIAALLKNIADITDTILRKTSGLPDLPSRIDRWVEQKKLSAWPSGLTWASFKKQLELFVQKLGKLQNKDLKTNTYLYLPELLNNVSLKNNLDRIYRSLKRYNELFKTSTIDIDTAFDDPLAGAGSLTTEAKDALLGILNTYSDTFYTQNILKDFDALIQKFDPTAQKLRTAEEEHAKKALEESKKPRTTGSIKQAGSKGNSSGGGSYYGEPSYDGGYYPGSSYSPGYSGGYPSYPSSYGDEKKDASGANGSGPSGSGTGGSGAKGTTGDKEAAATGVKEKQEDDSARYSVMAQSVSSDIAGLIESFGNEVKTLSSEKIENLFKKETPIDNEFIKKINDLSGLYKQIDSGLKHLARLTKKATRKAQYYDIIRESYVEYQQKIHEIFEKLTKVRQKYLDDKKSLTEEQRYFYFGDKPGALLTAENKLSESESLSTRLTKTDKTSAEEALAKETKEAIEKSREIINNLTKKPEAITNIKTLIENLADLNTRLSPVKK
jgi:hypothetical protein